MYNIKKTEELKRKLLPYNMKLISFILFLGLFSICSAQTFPGEGDNIDYLVTSGAGANLSAGDDDHQQSIFFLVPKNYSGSFYIRIYDPETSSSIDEINDSLPTKTSFSVYGGNGTLSNKTSRSVNYQSTIPGTQLKKRTFSNTQEYANTWFTFGPFNPKRGEFSEELDGYVIKLVIEGKEGNDVNLYKVALSSSSNANIPVSGANIFTYEYSFRLKSSASAVGHIYPYIDKQIISIKQYNFDADNDIQLKLFSTSKKGDLAKVSGNGNWSSSLHNITENEKGKCIDMQLQKQAGWHNDIVMYVLNQYDEAVPFFASPIGGSVKPSFKFKSEK